MAEQSLSPVQNTIPANAVEAAAQSAASAVAPAAAVGTPALTEPTGGPAPSTSGEPPKRPYPAPAELPTQQGAEGIRFDFNDGSRIVLPEGKAPWRVRLSDLDTGNIL